MWYTRSVQSLRPVVSILILAVTSCGPGLPGPGNGRTDVGRFAPFDDADAGKPVVYFGVISRYNPVVMYEEYQPIVDYLTSQTPYRFELKLGATYEDAVRFLETGETQVASLGGVTYLEARARFGARAMVRPVNASGVAFYRSIVVVRESSDLTKLSQLKGRSFCFGSPHSTSGNLFGRYALEGAGVSLEDLGSYVNLRHHDQVAKAVLSGRCDAGSVKDIVADRYRPKGLRFLSTSGPIPSVPIVINPDIDPAVEQAIHYALMRLNPEIPDHRQILESWNEEFRYGFVEARDDDYASLRDMLNDIPNRCGNSCHPDHTF